MKTNRFSTYEHESVLGPDGRCVVCAKITVDDARVFRQFTAVVQEGRIFHILVFLGVKSEDQ